MIGFVREAFAKLEFVSSGLYDVYDYDNKTSTTVTCWKSVEEPLANLRHHFVDPNLRGSIEPKEVVYSKIKFNLVSK